MIYEKLIEKELIFVNIPPVGSSYIMSDGKFLDLKNNAIQNKMENCPSNSKPNHVLLDGYILSQINNELEHKHDILKHTDNGVKLNDGTMYEFEKPYVDLPSNNLTTEQYASLELWLTNVLTKTELIYVGFNNNRHYKTFYTENATAKQIIKEIKKLYAAS